MNDKQFLSDLSDRLVATGSEGREVTDRLMKMSKAIDHDPNECECGGRIISYASNKTRECWGCGKMHDWGARCSVPSSRSTRTV